MIKEKAVSGLKGAVRKIAYVGAVAVGIGAAEARGDIGVGDQIGPYRITRSVTSMPNEMVDVASYNGRIYGVPLGHGRVQEIDFDNGTVSEYGWVPGDALHDNNPNSYAPNGFAVVGGTGMLATSNPLNLLWSFDMSRPSNEENPADVLGQVVLPSLTYDLASANGEIFYTTDRDIIGVIDPLSGAIRRSFNVPSGIGAIAHDGNNLWAIQNGAGTTRNLLEMNDLTGTVLNSYSFQSDYSLESFGYGDGNFYITNGLEALEIAVPEPGSLGLLALGAMVAGARKKKE